MVKKKGAAKKKAPAKFQLPTARRKPTEDPWQLAYLITGEKKIGKTTFAIEGCEEYVLQFDKPQLTYKIRETLMKDWKHFQKALKAIEARAEEGDFPFERIVVDGAGEWYSACQAYTCEYFGVEHPSDEGYARAWHFLRDEFTDAVNRLLALQIKAHCGLIFIAHCEWKEKRGRGGETVEKLVPNLPARCEETLNGKVDGWFTCDYVGENRIMIIQGDETTGAGHRIDGHFLTPDGRRVREIPMGESSTDALDNFIKAFKNKQPWTTYKEMRRTKREEGGTPAKKKSKAKKRR